MIIKHKGISLTYKIIAILVCIFGQILTLGLLNHEFKPDQFLFYTNQSNILCLVMFIASTITLIKSIKDPRKPSHIKAKYKGATMMAITVTMIIYWTMLNGEIPALEDMIELNPYWNLTNLIVHLIVPLLTIGDWLLFDPKGKFDRLDPIRWLIIPFVYYIFAIIVAQSGYLFYGNSRYAYFFIDPDIVGGLGVVMYIAILVLAFTLLGYLILLIDKLFSKL